MIGAFEGRAELSNAEAMMADVLSNLDARLRTADADRGALVRLGFQWPLEITAAAFGVAEQIRRAWFGADAPVFSDLRLPISRLRLDALFVGRSLRSHARRPLRPDDGLDNDALAVGPVLVTRGIAFPDEKTSLLRQTQACMDRLDAVLDAAGFAWSDIAKMSTYYVGGSSAEELHENLALRAARFSAPGPASTGVPVPGLPRAGEKIAVEAIAVREVQQ
jgi:enamine deaminase RidA (YjgF/YER057c/UK114 family)